MKNDRNASSDQDQTVPRQLEAGHSALAVLGRMAIVGSDFEALLRSAAELAAQTLKCELARVLELEPGGEKFVLRAGVGWSSDAAACRIGSELESQAGYTVLCNEPVIVEDLAHEKRFGASPMLHAHGVVSCASVVIEGQSAPFGVLGVYTKDRHTFSVHDITFLQCIANIVGGAASRAGASLDNNAARALTETKARELEASARRRTVVLETANRVAVDILSSRSGTEALRHIADAARVLAGARYAALGVAAEDGLTLTEFITVGLTPAEEAAIGPRPKGAGVLGVLLSRTEPLRINVLSDHSASVGFPANHPPMKSFLGVPIRSGETIVGSLYLTDKQGGGPFTEADETAVQALGAHAAVAIHNLQMLSRQRALVSSLMTAQEEERRAVAYDLHDGLTQYVMAAYAHMETFTELQSGAMSEDAAHEMAHGLKYLKEAVLESRRLVNGLRLLALDDLGLAGAIEQLLAEESARAGWEDAHLEQSIGEGRFDKTLETGVYRVVQEALTNVRKHAGAGRVRVLLQVSTEGGHQWLTVEVRDWGKGFEVNQRSAGPGHVGLQGIIERVYLLNGAFKINSAVDEGTALRATFPVVTPSATATGTGSPL